MDSEQTEANAAQAASATANDLFHYVDQFLRMKIAPALIQHNIFPTTKDITESVAMLNYAKRHFPELFSTNSKHDEQQPKSTVIVIGDGLTPRTGALFASTVSSSICERVIVIDPALKPISKKLSELLPKLQLAPMPIQSTCIFGEHIYIVMVHGHVTITDALNSVFKGTVKGVIVSPCCDYYVAQSLVCERPPSYQKYDRYIASKDNLVRVWALQKSELLLDKSQSMLRHRLIRTNVMGVDELMRQKLIYLKSKTTFKVLGIVSKIRVLGSGRKFFNIWQPTPSLDLKSDYCWQQLSQWARLGKLPQPHQLNIDLSNTKETFFPSCQCIQAMHVEIVNERKDALIKHGNIILVDGFLDKSSIKQYLLINITHVGLVTHYKELSLALLGSID
jgi:hypothetical protein